MIIILLFLILFTGGLFITFFQKALFWKKQPRIDQLWSELAEEDWYKELIQDPRQKEWIASDKENGLLRDPYFCRKIIDEEIHREVFINYIVGKTK
ncbi:hypothetical protein JCM9140_2348 [Halalkalibacter wakoensis JCM 9140]|uniref:Uncharacterized protein n=1 Tax=Halalkalibacter wakoensis JCM 9140 TaxID=1236970 RepID=W4Q4K5_9BACI|nr:hypothetical protein [Halalkalibacter wakoensis]GAE26299.1 hypothetical protein JCM9140_2348 [Halalkalibacter wakoensis JCM 9140]